MLAFAGNVFRHNRHFPTDAMKKNSVRGCGIHSYANVSEVTIPKSPLGYTDSRRLFAIMHLKIKIKGREVVSKRYIQWRASPTNSQPFFCIIISHYNSQAVLLQPSKSATSVTVEKISPLRRILSQERLCVLAMWPSLFRAPHFSHIKHWVLCPFVVWVVLHH